MEVLTCFGGVDVWLGPLVVASAQVTLSGEQRLTWTGLVFNTNGTKWFGVHVQDTCGDEQLLHMIITGRLGELSSKGSKVVYRIGTVMSATPVLTAGQTEVIFLFRTVAAALMVQADENLPLTAQAHIASWQSGETKWILLCLLCSTCCFLLATISRQVRTRNSVAREILPETASEMALNKQLPSPGTATGV